MARSRSVESPARNDVYFGMWLVAFLATALAVLLLSLELTDYGWDSKPPTATAQALPAVPVAAPKPAGTSMVVPDAKPSPIVEAAKPVPDEPAPAPALVLPPAPIPPSVVTQKPEPKSPVPTQSTPSVPSGPAPGGFELPKRR